MSDLHIHFQIPAEERHAFLQNFECSAPSLREDYTLDIVPYPGFNNILQHGGTVYAVKAAIYDVCKDDYRPRSKFFRAVIGNHHVVLKFVPGKLALEDTRWEATAYDELKTMQGQVMPFFKGIYSVKGDPNQACLITSDVGDSIFNTELEELPKDDRLVVSFGYYLIIILTLTALFAAFKSLICLLASCARGRLASLST